MTVVDASVWVSRLVTWDVNHTASRQWLEMHDASGGRLVAPVILLAEVSGAVSRRTNDARLGHQATATLLRLRALRLVAVDRRLGEAAARVGADLGLRGADAVYVALAQQLKLPLVTWDKEQQEKARRVVVADSPRL